MIVVLLIVLLIDRKEIKEGAEILAEKIRKYKPKIAAFNGKGLCGFTCILILIRAAEINK